MARVVTELRNWRVARGLSFDQAAELLKVDGKPINRSTWHCWESGRKIPAQSYMVALYALTGGDVRPEHFYDLPAIGTGNSLPITQPALV